MLPTVVSEGDITPEVVCEFEYHTKVFFMNAKGGIEDDQKVSRLLGCFHDPLVRDWITCEESTLKALPFADFLTSLRECWLDSDWEHALVTQILSCRLNPAKEKFETWAQRVQKLNVSLRGTASHFSDSQLRTQLEAALDEDLRILAADDRGNKTEGLLPWIERVRNLDCKRQSDRKRRHEEMEQFMRGPKRPFNNQTRNNTPSQPTNTDTTTDNPYPPKLTTEERQLLQENEGCFKCRRFFAGHRSSNCTVVLSGKGYKPLTTRDVARAKVN